MSWEAWTTVSLVAVIIGLLLATRIGPDLVMLGALAVLMTLRVLRPEKALQGFANVGMITVGVLLVVAAGIRETGAMGFLANWLLGKPKSLNGAQARMTISVAAMGAFVYNTTLVAMMLPVVSDWAKKHKLPVSKLMMPLSFAKILGGLCTLIGTSNNLIVNSLVVAQVAEIPGGLNLFDQTWVGLPCAVVGLAYILICNRWLLPERRPAISEQDDPRQYIVEMMVEPGSALVGQTIEEAGLRHLPGMYLVEIDRYGQLLAAVAPHERLQGNDRLVFAGVVESVVDLQKIRGLKPATDQVFKLNAPRLERCMIEAVVSNTCPLVGRTIREGRFRAVYNAAVIAVARNGERIRRKIGDITLQPGDTLLLEAHPTFVDQQRNSRDFFLVSRVEDSTPANHEKAWIAGLILFGMLVVAGVGWLTMVNAALLAAGLMILTGCCTTEAARRSIDWQVLLVIGASLGIGQAMLDTKAAETIAKSLISLAGGRPWIALALVYGVTMLFTELINHTASVVLVFPIAMATSHTLGVYPMAFVIAIMIASSCGFAMPLGEPTNLMVFGPGGYRFSDYLRFGGPLNLLVWITTVVLAPLVWPF